MTVPAQPLSAGKLSDHFTGVGAKRLQKVEADPKSSNQHEFNGVSALKDLLGTRKRSKVPAEFIYLGAEEEDYLTETGRLTWYDSRENHPTRSEWRLYFTSTAVSERMAAGDVVVFARRKGGEMAVIIAEGHTTAERQLVWLFDLPADLTSFQVSRTDGGRELGFAARTILAELGIEVEEGEERYLKMMLDRFGESFPTTRKFSRLARQTTDGVDPAETPDAAVMRWLEREELLFRTLERHFVEMRLEEGFGGDVDEFISYSLSVQNRRKSRAGHAFENHLEAIFDTHGLQPDRGAVTENRSKPDFLFPGQQAYHADSFPDEQLTMLGAKSTCKDRWRQVLAEADRVDRKHLITLEPGISENQTAEMKDQNLQLVLPAELHETYTDGQKDWLMTLEEFINVVKDRQGESQSPTLF
jgi:hypothetical protein